MSSVESIPHHQDVENQAHAPAGGWFPSPDRDRDFRPAHRPGTIRRARLLRELAGTTAEVPLVLLTAPAGYGKTTVLSQWAADDPRPFAWVDLDQADDDPNQLMRHLALALQRIGPLDPAVWRALTGAHTSVIGVALPRLITAATAGARPWVLVLDDVHLLRTNVAAELMVALANGLPPGFHVVLSGRSQAELRLSGLRSRGKCLEFGPQDLAFTPQEIGAVLSTGGIRPSERAVAVLRRRTEGWPAGVYLVALSLRGRAQPDVVANQIASSTAIIFDYLREEVLLRESADTVRFLLRTAPLDTQSGPLCDAVLGAVGSGTRLAEMAGRNLFVEPRDGDHHWYSYHPLFAEMLLAELRRREPWEESRTHRRAAAWYERQDMPDQAVSHALAARDTAQAARLVASYGERYLNNGRIRPVRAWLFRLACGALPDHPSLAVVGAWTWALTGDAARAQECLQAAERGLAAVAGSQSHGADRALRSGVLRLRAALAPLGVEQMLVDARAAEDLEHPGADWYPITAALLGAAQVLNGDIEGAVGALERAAHFAREGHRSAASFALGQLALIYAEKGDWVAAASYAAEAADRVRKGNREDDVITIVVHVAQARLALQGRDPRTARQCVGKALRLYVDPSPGPFPWLAAQMATALGRILVDLDDVQAARRKIADARRHLARLPTTGALGEEHARLAGEVARRGDRSRSSSAMTLTAAEMRVLRMLPTHLNLSEIADSLFLSRNTVKTQVASVYSKLLASNRDEAVRAARELRLIQ